MKRVATRLWRCALTIAALLPCLQLHAHDDELKTAIATAKPCVAFIQVRSSGDNPGGVGTGVIVDRQGYILTNAHVVRAVGGASAVTVTFHDLSTRAARIVAVDSGHDLALLKVAEAGKLPVLELGDSGSASPGPLLDSGGHVIGINTMVATSTARTAANGIGFAIAADTVKALLPALRAGG
mgnify:CR=1 FL=1